ncbi:MAG TPA: TlpA family protein disulfide reductase [Planctomicrobium sp.]|nr:TlpA family protein disulfide reductase [Planctomicrobium sp.]
MIFRSLACWSLILAMTGCAAPVDSASEKATAGEEAKSSETAREVTLEILDWDATRALVGEHKGKVVVLDIWATYCPPCVEEFPHLVKLQNEHRDTVACISVSADFDGTGETTAETHREKVHKFLQEQKATFQNVLLSTDTESLFGKKISHESIPVVMVFNQKGELAGEFPDPQNPDEFTYEKNVIPLVKSLLQAK